MDPELIRQLYERKRNSPGPAYGLARFVHLLNLASLEYLVRTRPPAPLASPNGSAGGRERVTLAEATTEIGG